MSNPMAFLCAAVLMGPSALAADVPTRLCEAFEREAKAGGAYSDVMARALVSLDIENLAAPWGPTLKAVLQSSPGDQLTILRAAATDAGQAFVCPALEYPAGKPKARALVPGDAGRRVRAVAADASGVYWLAGESPHRATLYRLDGATAKVLARAVPSGNGLVLSSDWVVLASASEVLAVPKAGGEARVLASGLTALGGLALDGDGVLFTQGPGVKRVPLAGGEVSTVVAALSAAPPAPAKGEARARVTAQLGAMFASPEAPTVVVPVGATLVVLGRSGALYRVPRAGGPAARLSERVSGPLVALEGVVYFTQADALAKLTLASGTVETVAAAPPGRPLLAHGGELLLLDGPREWPGKQRLVAWRPGAKSAPAGLTLVGAPASAASDGKRIVWLDRWWDTLLALPR